MPEPLSGLVPVADAGTKFECDVLVNRLRDAGIAATPSYDPAINSVAPHWATDRTFQVLVREEDVVDAMAVLSAGVPELSDGLDEPVGWGADGRTRRQRRVRRVAIVLLLSFVGLELVVLLMAVTSGD